MSPAEPTDGPGPGRNGIPASTVFWQDPDRRRDEVRWLEPPLDLDDGSGDGNRAEALLTELRHTLPGLPLTTWRLLWKYYTLARAATHELIALDRECRHALEARNRAAEQRRAEIEAELRQLKEQRQSVEQELNEALPQFAEAAARAGIECEPDPEKVQHALYEAQPSLDELAGRYGIGPATDGKQSPLHRVLAALFSILAPIVSGFVLALCLGTLVGILSLTDLQRNDRIGSLLLAAGLGSVIVYLLGEIMAAAVLTLARASEPPPTEAAGAPRLRLGTGMGALMLLFAFGLGVAEVTAEGLGIRELHLQRLEELRRLGMAADVRPLPMGAYLILGTLVSGPYLAYKAITAWGAAELRAREAWLLHHQRHWVEQRRATEEFRAAIAWAHRCHRLKSHRAELEARIRTLQAQHDALQPATELDPEAKARLDQARLAAVGERHQLDLAIDEIVDAYEALPTADGQKRPVIADAFRPRLVPSGGRAEGPRVTLAATEAAPSVPRGSERPPGDHPPAV